MKRYFIVIVIVILLQLTGTIVWAGERIGTIVLETMQRIETRQKEFIDSVATIQTERKHLVQRKEKIKEKLLKNEPKTQEWRGLHAEFTYVWAKILVNTFKEIKLLHNTAGDNIQALSELKSTLKNGISNMDSKQAGKMIKRLDGFIAHSHHLLTSLAKYRDMIDDPILRAKLNNAHAVALLLKEYTEYQKKNTYISQSYGELNKKVEEILAHLNRIYVETDVLMDMLRHKANLIKVANTISLAELLRDIVRIKGDGVVVPLDKVVDDTKKILAQTESDFGLMLDGVTEPTISKTNTGNDWTRGLK